MFAYGLVRARARLARQHNWSSGYEIMPDLKKSIRFFFEIFYYRFAIFDDFLLQARGDPLKPPRIWPDRASRLAGWLANQPALQPASQLAGRLASQLLAPA